MRSTCRKKGKYFYQKGRGTSLHGESLYFNFRQKWSKLCILLQKNANEAEIKEKFKEFDNIYPVITIVPSFDGAFC
jgi:hypothetical protein